MSSVITECLLPCAEGGDDAASHLLHCFPGEHHQVLVLAAGQQASPQLGAAHRQLQQLLQRLLQGYRRCDSSLLWKIPRFTFIEYSNCSSLYYEYRFKKNYLECDVADYIVNVLEEGYRVWNINIHDTFWHTDTHWHSSTFMHRRACTHTHTLSCKIDNYTNFVVFSNTFL